MQRRSYPHPSPLLSLSKNWQWSDDDGGGMIMMMVGSGDDDGGVMRK